MCKTVNRRFHSVPDGITLLGHGEIVGIVDRKYMPFDGKNVLIFDGENGLFDREVEFGGSGARNFRSCRKIWGGAVNFCCGGSGNLCGGEILGGRYVFGGRNRKNGFRTCSAAVRIEVEISVGGSGDGSVGGYFSRNGGRLG